MTFHSFATTTRGSCHLGAPQASVSWDRVRSVVPAVPLESFRLAPTAFGAGSAPLHREDSFDDRVFAHSQLVGGCAEANRYAGRSLATWRDADRHGEGRDPIVAWADLRQHLREAARLNLVLSNGKQLGRRLRFDPGLGVNPLSVASTRQQHLHGRLPRVCRAGVGHADVYAKPDLRGR